MSRLINPANGLTLSRFVAAPVALYLTLHLPDAPADGAPTTTAAVLLALLVVTMLTDLFDGMVARACKQVTDFGKIMDPVADSTFFMTLLFGFSVCPRFRSYFPIWFPIVVLWREVAMHVLRRYAALEGKVVAAKISGKAKMGIQCVAVTSFFLLLTLSDLQWYRLDEAFLGKYLYVCGALITAVNLISMIEYIRDVPDIVREWHDTPRTDR